MGEGNIIKSIKICLILSKIAIYPLWQATSVQEVDSSPLPPQLFPPLHVLVFIFLPEPQVTEQAPQLLQAPH